MYSLESNKPVKFKKKSDGGNQKMIFLSEINPQKLFQTFYAL